MSTSAIRPLSALAGWLATALVALAAAGALYGVARAALGSRPASADSGRIADVDIPAVRIRQRYKYITGI